MYDTLEGIVLVDNVPIIEGLLPAHGLSIFIQLRKDSKTKWVLFDSGPRFSILSHNASTLDIRLERLDWFVGSVSMRHHIGGFLENNELKEKVLRKALPPIPGKMAKVRLKEIDDGLFLAVSGSYWREQALVVETRKGWVFFIGCSVHGLSDTWKKMFERFEKIYGIIGGLGLSTRDVFNLEYLEKLVGEKNVKFVLPLHSTSIEAREYILEKYMDKIFGYDMSGAGVEFAI